MQGGGMRTDMFRCEKCDATKLVNRDEPGSYFQYKVQLWRNKIFGEPKPQALVCENCGGTMGTDLTPMCPKCGKREAELTSDRTVIFYD
jgi:uncharacterized OB-fold protein